MTETQPCDFLLEIGTEELPPKALRHLSEALGENLTEYLLQAELAHGTVKVFATPRRLAVIVESLDAEQKEKMVELRGPHIGVAFTLEGRPTQACLGFAEASGVAVEELGRITDKRGTYVVAKKIKSGEKVENLLPEIVNKSLKKLPIPRLMRWGEGKASFVRPVHWVVMLYGEKTVTGEILGINSGNKTYGHRFHCPEALVVTTPNQYEELLQQQGYVIADLQKRQQIIARQAAAVVGDFGEVLFDDDLLEETASLTEWPIALVGHFDERFLKLPPEVLMLALKKQQRCFPVVNSIPIENRFSGLAQIDPSSLDFPQDAPAASKRSLLNINEYCEQGSNKAENQNAKGIQPYFIAISNIASKQPECVIKGNENVILARLTDAEFFYRSDAQYLLESYFDKLEKTVFQKGLGNVYQKTLRLAELSSYIASLIKADVAATRRAAELSKSDLMTTMVGEFPELQGIVGYYYALREGLVETVARPLWEQYLPSFAKDKLPQTLEGSALAIADRIDTIVGVFSLGKAPTGERDPFALRRAAFGILRIILEQNLDIDLLDLVRRSLRKYLEQVEKFDELLIKNYQVSSKEQEKTLEEIATIVINKVMDFIFERQRSWYLDEGVNNNIFDAVRMREPSITRPLDFAKRLNAVKYFQALDESQILSAAHKRVKNILASAEKLPEKIEINQKLLKETAEIELATKVLKMTDVVKKYCAAAQYQEALQELATLKDSVDYFFNTVMVMVDDKKLRNNRLALLKEMQKLFYSVADIAYIS